MTEQPIERPIKGQRAYYSGKKSDDSPTEVSQCCQSGEKSSEITVVRDLLEKTGLDHHKISLDAHHCNPKTTT